jgi:hypothetical protein
LLVMYTARHADAGRARHDSAVAIGPSRAPVARR